MAKLIVFPNRKCLQSDVTNRFKYFAHNNTSLLIHCILITRKQYF